MLSKIWPAMAKIDQFRCGGVSFILATVPMKQLEKKKLSLVHGNILPYSMLNPARV